MIFTNTKKNILIIGYGEVGKSINKLYNKKKYNVYVIDKKLPIPNFGFIDVLNICIPYSNEFVDIVKEYKEIYNPKLTIIHSTVLPGTTKKISTSNIAYSPIIGVHPNLTKSIKTFKKFIGVNDKHSLKQIKKHFNDINIKYKVLKNTKTVETSKILSTLYYGMCISFHEDVDKLCVENNLPFDDVMTEWNKEYNRGYKLLGKENVVRPVLKSPKGKIGGHCIINNAKIIKEYFKSDVVDYVLRLK